MNLTKVTITGADDSIDPHALLALSLRYPFVEWGILLSQSSMGIHRFPSLIWMESLMDLKMNNLIELQISGHLCGAWVRNLCKGDVAFLAEYPQIFAPFDRMQLNFHALHHTIKDPNAFVLALKKVGFPNRQIIFQFDRVNDRLLYDALHSKVNAVPLFDTSGGIGRVPEFWPAPVADYYCGYAGGLGPDNLREEIEHIAEAVGDAEIWIDMETKVRSKDDLQFDLAKVEACLQIAEPFVSK